MATAGTIQWLLMLAVLLAGAAIVLAFLARAEAVPAALGALLAGSFSGGAFTPSAPTLLFWTMASVLAIGISVLLPAEVRRARNGVYFFATGALAGMAVGIAAGASSAVILCTAAGILFGALAYGNMRVGKTMDFPSRKFFNYLIAKGLPLLVTFSMLGIFFATALRGS